MHLAVSVALIVIQLVTWSGHVATSPNSHASRARSQVPDLPRERPLVIAHRGASGKLPEHTIRAYEQAILDGADYIECDVTLTKDLVPVCIHENALSVTTDVSARPEFADRRRILVVGVVPYNDWFAIDFTLEELKTLRKKQASAYRDPSFDGLYTIPILQEYIDVARNAAGDKVIGIYPELKDPEWLNSLNIMNGNRFEDILLDVLHRNGYTESSDRCFVQSFSEASLVYVAPRTRLPIIMLREVDAPNATLARWRELNFTGVGVSIGAISRFYNPIDGSGYKNWISSTTDLIARSHAHALKVHLWTFRNEDRFLAWDWEQDVRLAYDHFLALGADGFFTDFSLTLARYLDALYPPQRGEEVITPPKRPMMGM